MGHRRYRGENIETSSSVELWGSYRSHPVRFPGRISDTLICFVAKIGLRSGGFLQKVDIYNAKR